MGLLYERGRRVEVRDCPKGYTVARNIQEAIHYLDNYKINILSLDHDLGEDRI